MKRRKAKAQPLRGAVLVLDVTLHGGIMFSKVTSAVADGRRLPVPRSAGEAGDGWPHGAWWGGVTLHLDSVLDGLTPGKYAVHVRRLATAEEQARDVAKAQDMVARALRKGRRT